MPALTFASVIPATRGHHPRNSRHPRPLRLFPDSQTPAFNFDAQPSRQEMRELRVWKITFESGACLIFCGYTREEAIREGERIQNAMAIRAVEV